jgi:hypothetical protein
MPDNTNTLTKLIASTRSAYRALERGEDTTTVYAALEAAYAAEGLDANVAESSVDWYEMGVSLLTESLNDALDRATA